MTGNNDSKNIDFNAIKKTISDPKNRINLRFCKKTRQNRTSQYSFHNAGINKEIEECFREWLTNSIKWIENRGILDNEVTSNNNTCFQAVDLNSILNWNQFNEKAFKISENISINISKYKSNLHSQIIFTKTADENYIIGQISKLTPAHVMKGKNEFFLFHNGSTFNSIYELNDGVKLKKFANFFFIMSKSLNIGIIINEENFEQIFDMNEQYEHEAITNISKSAIFASILNQEEIISIVKDDRNIQKMLRNPVTKQVLSIITLEAIIMIKEELRDLLPYNIIDEEKIEFAGNDQKEELKVFIKSISHHYNHTLWGNKIVEGTPSKFIRE